MKAQIQTFIHQLLIYDYLLFGGIILFFLILLLVAILLRNRLGLAIFFVLLAFAVLTAGPVVGYITLHNYLFKHKIVIREIKALEFTEALLIKGDINNTSKRTFTECTVSAGVYKVSHNPVFDRLYPLIPFKKGSLKIDTAVPPGKSVSFKFFIEPFRYSKDYNVTLKANCR